MSVYKSLSIRPLTRELQNIAESELNETPQRVETDLQHIKDWLSKQSHLNCRTDNQFLMSFLRASKFSLQRTKEKLDFYCTIKTLLPEYFENRDPLNEDIQSVLNVGGILPIPTSENYNGPKFILVNWPACDPEKISFITLMKVFFMFLDVLLIEDDSAVVSGIGFWGEMKKWPIAYALQCTPPVLKKVTICFENGFPFRIKGIYCTNIPKTAETVANIVKAFLTEKLKNRFEIYGESNANKIFKHMSKKAIPKDLGGEGESIENLKIAAKNKIEGYRRWFIEDKIYRTKEENRMGTPRTTADLFGVEGSFRKLIID